MWTVDSWWWTASLQWLLLALSVTAAVLFCGAEHSKGAPDKPDHPNPEHNKSGRISNALSNPKKIFSKIKQKLSHKERAPTKPESNAMTTYEAVAAPSRPALSRKSLKELSSASSSKSDSASGGTDRTQISNKGPIKTTVTPAAREDMNAMTSSAPSRPALSRKSLKELNSASSKSDSASSGMDQTQTSNRGSAKLKAAPTAREDTNAMTSYETVAAPHRPPRIDISRKSSEINKDPPTFKSPGPSHSYSRHSASPKSQSAVETDLLISMNEGNYQAPTPARGGDTIVPLEQLIQAAQQPIPPSGFTNTHSVYLPTLRRFGQS